MTIEARPVVDVAPEFERILVAVSSAPDADRLIRRAANLAASDALAFLAVHVRSDEGAASSPEVVASLRGIVDELGGVWHAIRSDDVPGTLVDVARSERCTTIIVGASRRSRWHELTRGSLIRDIVRAAHGIDVHVVSSELLPPSRPRISLFGWSTPSTRRQLLVGFVTAVVFAAITILLAQGNNPHSLATPLLSYLAVIVIATTIGGWRIGVVAAAAAALLTNYYFTLPKHSLRMSDAYDVVAVAAFMAVTILVSTLMGVATNRANEAVAARRRAESFASVNASLVGDPLPLHRLLAEVRSQLGQDTVGLEHFDGGSWSALIIDGTSQSASPQIISLDESLRLLTQGPELRDQQREFVRSLGGVFVSAWRAEQLHIETEERRRREAGDAYRTALLRAVSHDLRTPLTSIKTSVSSLRSDDVRWTDGEAAEFLETIETESDRLDRLIANLLDMSRLQTGGLDVKLQPTSIAEVAADAVASLSSAPVDRVVMRLDHQTPSVHADPVLLERVVANLVANALRVSSAGQLVEIDAVACDATQIELSVVDHGPGIPAEHRQQALLPFQRLDDRTPGGLGLGLAITLGLVEAMGGSVRLDETPGGGLTATIRLRCAD